MQVLIQCGKGGIENNDTKGNKKFFMLLLQLICTLYGRLGTIVTGMLLYLELKV